MQPPVPQPGAVLSCSPVHNQCHRLLCASDHPPRTHCSSNNSIQPAEHNTMRLMRAHASTGRVRSMYLCSACHLCTYPPPPQQAAAARPHAGPCLVLTSSNKCTRAPHPGHRAYRQALTPSLHHHGLCFCGCLTSLPPSSLVNTPAALMLCARPLPCQVQQYGVHPSSHPPLPCSPLTLALPLPVAF